MMKYLQKLGKALMLPVAVLPICGILMGLGYALAPGVMGVPGAPTSGAAYTVGFLLVKAGGALIDNMAWLFAIGAAVGLADNDGTAGLAGLVSFLMMQHQRFFQECGGLMLCSRWSVPNPPCRISPAQRRRWRLPAPPSWQAPGS